MNYSCFGPLSPGSRGGSPSDFSPPPLIAAHNEVRRESHSFERSRFVMVNSVKDSEPPIPPPRTGTPNPFRLFHARHPMTSSAIPSSRSADTIFNSKTSDLKCQRFMNNSPSCLLGGQLEVIQDLDLYFIRQIAHSLQEFDLEQKIDLEIKMREGTTKLLAACKHPGQSLEAAKSLVTSNERMTAYMAELQRRKVQERRNSGANSISQVKVEPSKGKMAVSDIRMPLIWKDTDHFKNKGDYRRFSVFCLLRVGTEIYDSMMVENVDRSMTDITFDDVIHFNQVPSDFEFKLEVYSHVLHNDMSIASTPRKIKKKISSSVSRTIGRKLASTLKEELNSFEIGPKFDLVAHATLKLSDTGDDIRTHDLILENLENPQQQLPLFGHFCTRVAVQPDAMTLDRHAGYLGLVHQVGEVSGCRRMWSTLKNFKLSFWAKADDSQTLPPVLTLTVNKTSSVQTTSLVPNYPLSFMLSTAPTSAGERSQENYLNADSDVDYHRWIAHIRQHIKDNSDWGHASVELMELPSPGPMRVQHLVRQRHPSSLYDATPVRGIPESPSQSSILTESNHRMSPPASLRSRSSSTSSAASSVSSSTRGQFNFFRFKKFTNSTSKEVLPF